MTAITSTLSPDAIETFAADVAPDRLWRRVLGSRRVLIGGTLLAVLLGACLYTFPWTARSGHALFYDRQDAAASLKPPAFQPWDRLFGTDPLGHSLLGRCLLGGVISLTIGIAAATISVTLGVAVGILAGYRGGWVDALLMRLVDILYGLPYILLVILFKIAFERPLASALDRVHIPNASNIANLVVLFLAIGLVSWLTMARIIRGQVLSLRTQPFIEACRAGGLREWRIFTRHLLPNLVGPIIVYATLTVPQAILQESLLSFIGVGIRAPMPTWGSLASDGLGKALNPVHSDWWLLVFPCTLLAVTLLCLNFVGDGLRDVFDPRRDVAKI